MLPKLRHLWCGDELDVRLAGMLCRVILVIVLGLVETVERHQLGHDRRVEDLRRVELAVDRLDAPEAPARDDGAGLAGWLWGVDRRVGETLGRYVQKDTSTAGTATLRRPVPAGATKPATRLDTGGQAGTRILTT